MSAHIERGTLTQATSKPCAECPFRKTSPRGWLGPWTVDSIMSTAFSEVGLACHMTVKQDGRDDPKVRACAGSLISANVSCKRFVAPNMVEMQEQLAGHADESKVLTQWEFREHHAVPASVRRKQGGML